MKKLYLLPFFTMLLLLAACGGGENNPNAAQDEDKTIIGSELEAPALTDIPGLGEVETTDRIILQGSDDMRYDKDLFKVKAGQKVKLSLSNVGKLPIQTMGHNVVVLKKGTDVASFGNEAQKAADNEYIPSAMASSIIAHTKLLGPGQSDEIEFTLPDVGVYEYICSFPGHWGIMRGKIVAE